jgi:hypothetical protein
MYYHERGSGSKSLDNRYQIKENMGGACGTYGKDVKFMHNFGWKPVEHKTFGKVRNIYKDNIKMDLKQIAY